MCVCVCVFVLVVGVYGYVNRYTFIPVCLVVCIRVGGRVGVCLFETRVSYFWRLDYVAVAAHRPAVRGGKALTDRSGLAS